MFVDTIVAAYTWPMAEPIQQLACIVPERLHPMCERGLEAFVSGQTVVHTPAYVCNMVDSSLIPLVECLLATYADGVLLLPAFL